MQSPEMLKTISWHFQKKKKYIVLLVYKHFAYKSFKNLKLQNICNTICKRIHTYYVYVYMYMYIYVCKFKCLKIHIHIYTYIYCNFNPGKVVRNLVCTSIAASNTISYMPFGQRLGNIHQELEKISYP